MNAKKYPDSPHWLDFSQAPWRCIWCGLTFNDIDGLGLRECSRILAIRERIDASDGARPSTPQTQDANRHDSHVRVPTRDGDLPVLPAPRGAVNARVTKRRRNGVEGEGDEPA